MPFFLLPKIILLNIIRFYQKTISPDHGRLSLFHPFGHCKFHPTCSQYAYGAIEKYGVIKGGFLATLRLLRCNPFSKGGHDPVR